MSVEVFVVRPLLRQRVGAYFIMVLHQLDDDSNVIAVVLYGDDSHDIGSIFGIGVLAVLVS